jgi:hypothetical protein
MKAIKLFACLIIVLCFMQACHDKPATGVKRPITSYTADEYNNTKGYWENGQIITEFDCPDSKFFSPIDLRSWDKTPVVNGRLPTYEETLNGTSIHHYGEKENSKVKPYNMTLPKLAYRRNPLTKLEDIVVVIQIVQTDEDTIVGFRYLTGGCGGSSFRNYRFLADEEVKNITRK